MSDGVQAVDESGEEEEVTGGVLLFAAVVLVYMSIDFWWSIEYGTIDVGRATFTPAEDPILFRMSQGLNVLVVVVMTLLLITHLPGWIRRKLRG